MDDYVIITDSGCDLPAELVQALGIVVLPLNFRLNGKTYKNYLDGRNLSFNEFYLHIRGGTSCTTNPVSPVDFSAAAEPYLQNEQDVLFVCLSSGLSTTWNAAASAAKDLAAHYPQRAIRVVDSLSASLGEGLLVYYAAQKRKTGASLAETADWLEQNKLRLCHWYVLDDLQYLQHRRQVNPLSAFFGTLAETKLLTRMDSNGHLVCTGKVRGKRSALDTLVSRVEQSAVELPTQTIFISHADAARSAAYVSRQIQQRLGVKKILTGFIGPSIGVHTGPGAVAVFFLGNER